MSRVGVGEASTTRPVVVLVGAAGAGKGTQASILAAELGYRHLATGDLFRSALRDRTVLGEQARVYMERGDLVPDELAIGLVAEALADQSAAGGVILDGFPRTAAQARALEIILAAGGDQISRVVAIDVSEADLVARLSGRWSCPACGTPYHLVYDPPRQPGICNNDGTALTQREDDRVEVVRARLTKQIPPMREVIAHYRAADLLSVVDGSLPIDEVTAAIRAEVGA